MRRALAGMTALASVASAHADRALPEPQFAAKSGIEMRLSSYYEDAPPLGFMPIRIAVKNGDGSAHTWRVDAEDAQPSFRSVRSAISLTVPAESEKTFDLLVPLVNSAESSWRYTQITIVVQGFAVVNGVSSHSYSGGGRTPTPFLGMGTELSVPHWGPLQDSIEKARSKSLDGTSLDPAMMPGDWRGLAGFQVIIFTDAEWRQLSPAARGALQDWIARGGLLALCTQESAAPADLPPAGAMGCGRLEYWTQGPDFVERVAELLEKTRTGPELYDYDWQWKLAAAVGRAEPPKALILIFVVCFAAVIGPINFLVLAPVGHRHRLFWTTPLISVTASVLMGGFIALSEGVGGTGRRFEAVLSLPDTHKAMLWQEQVSRTGVLVSNAFTPTAPAVLMPLSLRRTTSSPYSADRGLNYFLDGETWSGDWFRSRTTQAQLFEAALDTRGRIDLAAEAVPAPALVSSFENRLAELWFLDERGTAWYAKDVKPGEKITLQRGEKKTFYAWLKTTLEAAGPVARGRVEAFRKGNPTRVFYATAEAIDPIESLRSIRWKNAGAILFGYPAK